MKTDPVCGMTVEPDKATVTELNGQVAKKTRNFGIFGGTKYGFSLELM